MGEERMEWGENDIVVLKRRNSSFKIRLQKCETSACWIKSNQALIKHLWESNCISWVKRPCSRFFSWGCDVGLSHQGDGNEHRRWSVGPIDTCASPWALPRSPLLLLFLCHPSVSPMVSSHGLLLRYNRFHLPVKPPGRLRSGTKDSMSEREKKGRRDFSLQYKHISSLPSPPLKLPRQIKSKDQNAAESLFSFCLGYYNSAWLLDSFMNN